MFDFRADLHNTSIFADKILFISLVGAVKEVKQTAAFT
jgi:hypothetical protein